MPFSYEVANLQPAFDDRPIPYIAFGQRFHLAAAEHVEHTLNSSRAFLIVSASLAKKTPQALQRIQDALGTRLVGTRVGMSPHTRWNEVVEVANEARPHNPDCLITLGAGSLTDAAKIIAWMLANDITTADGLDTMWKASPTHNADLKPATIRTVAVPTSLSGGEYQALAGATRDDGSQRKCGFHPPPRNPSLVILDPDLATTTPERVWLSTGVRAVDHCVETLCSLQSTAEGDEKARAGLLKLVPSLLRTKHDPHDLDARFDSMMGVIDAMAAVGQGVPLGGSHAIGHQLGPLGVGHGETSCVMLPAVCKWTAKHGGPGAERQTKCRDTLLRSPAVKSLIAEKFPAKPADQLDLGDVLDIVIRELGMPRTLKDVGIGRDKLNGLAANTLQDAWSKTNSTPITDKAQVLEILEMVVE